VILYTGGSGVDVGIGVLVAVGLDVIVAVRVAVSDGEGVSVGIAVAVKLGDGSTVAVNVGSVVAVSPPKIKEVADALSVDATVAEVAVADGTRATTLNRGSIMLSTNCVTSSAMTGQTTPAVTIVEKTTATSRRRARMAGDGLRTVMCSGGRLEGGTK
jgi:hypothetical protein